MFSWNWNQYKAAGKHVASVVAGAVGMAVALHFITPQQATDVNGNLTSIFTGLQQVATGIAGISAVVVPIYTAWRAAHNASPTVQAQSLVATANNTSAPEQAKIAQVAIAAAVIDANDLKVNGTISAPAAVAEAIPSEKVVSK